jgi:hypothetical protein
MAAAVVTVAVGIADSDGDTFADPHWAGLEVRMGRAVAPYDVALTDPVPGTPAGDRRIEFDAWMSNASAAGVEPLVTFEASRRTPGVAPTADAFAHAMRAFLATYPAVRHLAPWNEPNFRGGGNPLDGDAALAAGYWRALVAVAGDRTVAAGEFAGAPGDPYVDRYLAALGDARPDVWAFHAHTDPNRFQAGVDDTAPATRYLLDVLGRRWPDAAIWIDEIGAYYRDAHGHVWGDDSQRAATSFILGLATLSPRIERIYYYNFANECSTAARCAIQDRGVVSPSPLDGTPLDYDDAGRRRTSYAVIRDRGPVVAPGAP